MSAPQGKPAGWYVDPWQPGMQRWWDGTQWTQHQTWAGASTAPPAAPPEGAPAAPLAPSTPPASYPPATPPGGYPPAPPGGGYPPAPGYGQSPYGQNPYGQGAQGPYAQDPSGQQGQPGQSPQYGQPVYGQPVYGQPYGYHQGPTGPGGAPMAEWWRRLFGYIIDGFVLIPFYLPLVFVLIRRILDNPAWQRFIDAAESGSNADQLQAQQDLTTSLTTDLVGLLLVITLYAAVVSTLYFTLCIGKWGRTLGGKLMGIKAVRDDGSVPGYGVAFKRYLPILGASLLGILPAAGGLLSNGLLLLIFLSMFMNPQRRAWHDLFSGTWVIRA